MIARVASIEIGIRLSAKARMSMPSSKSAKTVALTWDTARGPGCMIPNIFHFVYGFRPQTEPFPLIHFLAIRSCLEVNRPQQVMVHCAKRPWGPWWVRLAGGINVVDVSPASEVTTHEYD